MNRRNMLMALTCAAVTSLASAETFPDHPITFEVGYTAGGAVDTLGRLIAKGMSDKLGQSIVVENRPGASETLAAQKVAKSKADGYTVLVSTEAPITQAPFLYKSMGYNPQTELLPVTIGVKVPMAMVVRPDFPARDFSAFLAEAKKRQPGKGVKFGSAGVGGVTHLPAAMLASKAGIDWVHVPYKGSPPLMQDLMAGRVDAAFTGFSNALSMHKSGKVRILAVGAGARIKSIPDVPTFKEAGLEGIGAKYLVMLSVPAGTPQEVVKQLASTAHAVVEDKSFQEKYLDPYGYEAVGSTPAEAASYIAADRPFQQERIKVSGATMN